MAMDKQPLQFVYPNGIKCTSRWDHHETPKPGDMIQLTSTEACRKYSGERLFEVVECLDGSNDVWFQDDMPYSDIDGNDVQSRCRPSECRIARYEKYVSRSVRKAHSISIVN